MMDTKRALQLLTSRLDFVDIAILGKVNDDPKTLIHLKDRLEALSSSGSKVEREIPQIGLCRELILKLKPFLSKSKSSLTQTMERLDAALAIKSELEDIVNMLITVENTTKSADIFASIEIASYQDEIRKVESLLKPLQQLSCEQAEELDEFLSIYENTVTILIVFICFLYHILHSSTRNAPLLTYIIFFIDFCRWRYYRKQAINGNLN